MTKIVKKLLIFAALTAFAAVASCSNTSPKKLIRKGLYDCSDRFQTAMNFAERRNHNNAVRIFEEIKFQCGGSAIMDSVYFFAGMSHFRLKQYEDARAEFDALRREHPRSPFIEEAHFRTAQMRYIRSLPPFRDQTDTKEAMRLLNDHAEMFPKGVYADSVRTMFMSALNKLAEKELNTARFYLRQKEHNAALIYYRAVVSEYPDSKYAPEAIVGMAEMMVELGRVQEAREVMEELDLAAFDEGLRERLQTVMRKL